MSTDVIDGDDNSSRDCAGSTYLMKDRKRYLNWGHDDIG